MKRIKTLLRTSLVLTSGFILASCAGIAQFKQASQLPLVKTTAVTNEQGQVLNSQNIPYESDYPTYFNPDNDPFQAFNRFGFGVNYYILDKYLLRPIAVFNYNYVAQPIKDAANSLYWYSYEPFSLLSNMLTNQGKAVNNDFLRIVVNGVFGLGTIDWASQMGIFSNNNDFGYVAAYFGVKTGPYLMIPGYGATYPRKLLLASGLENALTAGVGHFIPYYGYVSLPLTAFYIINLRSNLISEENLLRTSPDKYEFTKSVFTQNANYRQSKALGTPVPQPVLSPSMDDDFLNSLR